MSEITKAANEDYAYLKENIETLNQSIEAACRDSGRKIDEIHLIGVTKTYEPDVINASIRYGIREIAENRVQEITRKFEAISTDVEWHLIGHLQTNKVKYIIDKVKLIHSVDSLKLAEEIQKRAAQINKVQEILIQINIADEEQKFGIQPDDLPQLLESISKMDCVRVVGLMNIAPLVENVENLRADFKQMKRLFDGLEGLGYSNVKSEFLSMGMSNDYRVAIEEGSNMIRVGTAIYGKRNYTGGC
jgi:pyridoxal phosphate enzyme (YggS family)